MLYGGTRYCRQIDQRKVDGSAKHPGVGVSLRHGNGDQNHVGKAFELTTMAIFSLKSQRKDPNAVESKYLIDRPKRQDLYRHAKTSQLSCSHNFNRHFLSHSQSLGPATSSWPSALIAVCTDMAGWRPPAQSLSMSCCLIVRMSLFVSSSLGAFIHVIPSPSIHCRTVPSLPLPWASSAWVDSKLTANQAWFLCLW